MSWPWRRGERPTMSAASRPPGSQRPTRPRARPGRPCRMSSVRSRTWRLWCRRARALRSGWRSVENVWSGLFAWRNSADVWPTSGPAKGPPSSSTTPWSKGKRWAFRPTGTPRRASEPWKRNGGPVEPRRSPPPWCRESPARCAGRPTTRRRPERVPPVPATRTSKTPASRPQKPARTTTRLGR